jgi:hypothetical protein
MAEIFTIILASRPIQSAIAPGQLGADLSLIALKHATQKYSHTAANQCTLAAQNSSLTEFLFSNLF